MATPRSRAPRHSQQQWAEWIEEQEHSGLSVEEFCARHRVGPSTFHKWRSRLTGDSSPTTHKPHSGGFVEALPASRTPAPIIVRLNNDVQLEIPTTLDAHAIAEIMHALVSHDRG
jgi:transposase-like protein